MCFALDREGVLRERKRGKSDLTRDCDVRCIAILPSLTPATKSMSLLISCLLLGGRMLGSEELHVLSALTWG